VGSWLYSSVTGGSDSFRYRLGALSIARTYPDRLTLVMNDAIGFSSYENSVDRTRQSLIPSWAMKLT
jgi:hypothetical protein